MDEQKRKQYRRKRHRRTKHQQVPAQEPKGAWLANLDQRTALAHELSDRLTQLVNDLGGEENLSYQKRVLCERVIWLEHYLRHEEEKLASGEPFDSNRWSQSVNVLAGLLSKLGLERQSKGMNSLDAVVQTRGGKRGDQ